MHVAGAHAPPLMDTSILDTAMLSVAEPLTIYGSAETLFKVEPFNGLTMLVAGSITSNNAAFNDAATIVVRLLLVPVVGFTVRGVPVVVE